MKEVKIFRFCPSYQADEDGKMRNVPWAEEKLAEYMNDGWEILPGGLAQYGAWQQNMAIAYLVREKAD